MTDSIIVTGGAGFIGSSLIRRLITRTDYTVVNVDKLTYAGNLESLEEVAADSRYRLEQVDICETEVFRNLLDEWEPVGVIHLAAESHVDRSIDGPAEFIETNVVGTFSLLRAALDYWSGLPEEVGSRFRFLHVSTDEVFGSLADEGAFTEDSPYRPSSPYSASKAAADHLVRAWHRTYGLPVCVTYCGNNYGPYQYPEKLIPLTIVRGLAGKTLPVYGEGSNVRNWIHVDDHVRALLSVFEEGESGATYAVGTGDELRNLEVVTRICDLLDELEGPLAGGPRRALIRFVDDRPGHDYRYAIDSGRLRRELGWTPRVNLDAGLRATVEWYVNHAGWCERALGDSYRAERLGLAAVRP